MPRCAAGRSSSTASSRRAPSPSPSCSRATRCSRSPTAFAAGTRRSAPPTSRSRSRRACCSTAAGCRSRRSASTCPRNLVSTLVMCAVPAQVAGVEKLVVCTPPARRRARRRSRRGARGRRGVGARRAAGDRLARVRPPGRQDRRARERLRERGEARGAARRRDRPARAARPRWSSSPRARSTRGSSSSSSRRRASTAPTRSAASSRRSRRPRRSRPSTSCCSASAEALAGRVRNAGAVFVGADLARGCRRLRDRRQPRPADERLGALDRRARHRDVPQAGDDAAAHAPRGSRCIRPDGRGARSRRGDAGARRGGAPVKPLSSEFRAYTWAPPNVEVARLAGIDPSQVVRFDQNTPPLPLPSTRPGHDRGRARRHQRLPARRLRRAAPRDRRVHRRRPRPGRARHRRRRPHPPLRALLRRARATRSRSRRRRPTRSTASRPSSRAPRSATTIRC